MHAPRASTKARTAGGRLRRMGPRGPPQGRSPLRGLRPPQTARPRPADPSASGTRTPLRGTRKSTKPMLWNPPDAPLPAAQGDAGFDEVCGGGAVQDGVSWLFVSGRRPVFVSRRRARSAGRSGRVGGRRRALLDADRRPSRSARLGRAPDAGLSWPRAQRGTEMSTQRMAPVRALPGAAPRPAASVWEAAEQAQGQWRTFKRRPANGRAKPLTTFGHAPRAGRA